MKKTVTIAAGVLMLGVVLYAGNRLFAQGARPAAAPQTRVALLNVRYVYKHYEKYKAFIESLQGKEKKFVDDMKAQQTMLEQKNKAMATSTDVGQREKLEQEIRDIQRRVEDERNKARREATRELQEETVKIYREIRDAAYRHAQAHNYEIVLQYEGAIDGKEMDAPGMITRGLSVGACYPLWWNPGLDISGHVLHALNTAYGKPATPAPAGN